MSNKMLIDASHPEETRVAVVRGNRIEEFDFESQEKKQLRGNIYLAKVTRVEPSLQAAFVDYGGNRHGFLAFSEIHPDYYQIPVADRQALLEAEAAEARAHREAEEQEDAQDDEVSSPEAEAEEPAKKKPRRRRARKPKEQEPEVQAEEQSNDGDAATGEQPDVAEPEASSDNASANANDDAKADVASDTAQEESAPVEEKPKPKRRTTRRKPAAKKTKAADVEETAADGDVSPTSVEASSEQASDTSSDDASSDDGGEPTTMAAIVEMDSISEDLPDESGDDNDESASTEEASPDVAKATDDASEETNSEAEEKPKPKRRTSRRKPAAKKATENVEPEAEKAPEAEAETAEDAPAQSETPEAQAEVSEEKPKKKTTRRRSPRSKKKAEEAQNDASEETHAKQAPNSDVEDENADNHASSEIEQVGQEDALEEVPNPRRQRRHYKIQEVIKRRQVLLVQVVKEERGNKGAALTTYLSLAGRYSVLMPNTARGGGISRKITNATDRKRLKGIASKLDVPQGMGVILRTAGASRTDVEINRDFEYLMRLWEKVRNLTLSSTAPCLVYEEGSLIKRSIRDLYDKDTGEVLVCGEAGFNEAKDFMGMLMPEHTNKVKHYTESQAIFTKFGVESHLERMVAPQVTMKSGGYLVINQTEALVAVDVNSGRSTREHSIEDTALQTNLEAAEEVARQLRLRDLAGLIVIDFIDMEEKRNNRAVEKRLKDCLKNDRARIQVGRISHFGLLEMSRQRMRSSVLESTMDVCEHCSGLGYIRSDSAIALHVFRAIEEHVARHNKFDAVIKTTRAIAFHILNHKRASLLELELKYGLQVIIEGDATISGQEFVIEKGEASSGKPAAAVVGFQNEAASDAVAVDDEDENKGTRRKRGRKRRRNEESEEDVQETASTNENNEDDAGEDDDRPRRKRRRGKRGGRRRNASEAENNAGDEEQTSTDSPAEDNAPETQSAKAQDTSDSQPETVASNETAGSDEVVKEKAPEAEAKSSTDESAEEKPARRSTQRKRVTQKAPVQPKADVEDAETSEEASSETKKEEPPRPTRRRTTRRVVSEDAPEEVAQEATSEAPQKSEKSPEPETAEPEVKESATEKPTKKGWWNRGGGFF